MNMNTKLLTAFIAVFLVILVTGVSALTISSVTSSPDKVAPGQRATLDLNIDNNFEDDATDVSVKLILDNLPIAPYGEGVEKTLDKINTDKGKEISFDVVVASDAKSQTYKIPVLITYKTNNIPVTKTDFVSLIVISKPEISVTTSDYLIKGKEKTLTVKIINSGLENVKFLSIKINPVSGITLLSSQKEYIGDLNSDDSDSAEFKIIAQESAASQINIPFEVTYTDSATKSYTENYNINLKVYSEKEAIQLGLTTQSNGLLYIGGMVIIILVFIFYRMLKRKRRKE